ncbi:DNA-3-methyladenine glycosylase 2 family protein [Actinoplanes sp. TRM 88003]|uniref:DNA-3-methyladenine glycosylase II n=1 Tax=Paractinoplanes aksuensis TaxID=2939490 RepID=A0ABT1DFK0_9ACTN|nr:DNA-3-methyladenine glycosylase 2 family protein [Actinoplanes aksuensis]MCO8269263.1 DNA-3-methyladenine glycosylase 2 family protein [Actinoplanes aksuensis]
MELLAVYPDGTPLDATDRQLAAADPVLRGLIGRFGPVSLFETGTDLFGSLILAIVSQQFSTRAARAMFDRVLGQFGGEVPSAQALLAADPDELRVTAGLSHAKTRALRSLAERMESGGLDLDDLRTLPDDEVRARLTAISGIGDWTAGVFLMFTLRRPDILPADDLVIRKAVRDAYRLDSLPAPADVIRLGESWRPYRSRACSYLWRSLQAAPIPATS